MPPPPTNLNKFLFTRKNCCNNVNYIIFFLFQMRIKKILRKIFFFFFRFRKHKFLDVRFLNVNKVKHFIFTKVKLSLVAAK